MSAFNFTPTRFKSADLQAALVPAEQLSLISASLLQTQTTPIAATATATEAVTQPMFTRADERFGELRQVDQIRDLYLNARRSVDDLRQSALVAGRTTENALLYRVLDFLRRHGARIPDTVLSTMPVNVRQVAAQEGVNLMLNRAVPQLDEEFIATLDGKPQRVKHNDQSALFGSGAVMVEDLRSTEALRHALSVVLRQLSTEIQEREEAVYEIDTALPAEYQELDARSRDRVEKLEDYLVAQRLLADHWQAVEQAFAERRRVLESHRGLYYVKVRETPLSLTLPDPLELRYGADGDLVPGCSNRDASLPEALTPFLNAVLDVPMEDWAALHDLHPNLPGREWLGVQVEARKVRLSARPAPQQTEARAGLLAILQQNQTALKPIADRPFLATSLKELQLQGRAILSLEDLLGSTNPLLRGPAQQQHQRLVAAAACLLERLRGISPSVRLAWAAAAEADTLAVETPERWSGLAQAEDADFNGVRTLVELVGWWFRQLDAGASAPARTALRNFVRACLLLAVNDDPQELLQGSLRTLPSRFRLGETLRVDLNREPRTGALLQLIDGSQRVVGTLRVDDHDANGTLTSIVSVLDPRTILSTTFRVSGQSLLSGS